MEIGWASDEALAEFQKSSPILFSDEQNVFDETVAYALPQGSETAFDRQPNPIPNGVDPYDRVAELIDDLAALNQVGADVQQLIHTGRLS